MRTRPSTVDIVSDNWGILEESGWLFYLLVDETNAPLLKAKVHGGYIFKADLGNRNIQVVSEKVQPRPFVSLKNSRVLDFVIAFHLWQAVKMEFQNNDLK